MVHTVKPNNIVDEFESINELIEVISKANNNEGMYGQKESMNGSKRFTGTASFEEAINLLKHGDTVNIEKLMASIKLDKNYTQDVKTTKNEYNVHGYQASVPRYLQGIPTSMVNSKKVQQKQKVINLVKSCGYNAYVSTDEIIEQSKKAIQIIQLVESKGYRVNLKLVWNVVSGAHSNTMIVQIKHSGEKLNLAKLAFPLANPSMLRRIGFRWLEVVQDLKNTSFRSSYGKSIYNGSEIKKNAVSLEKAYIIPSFVEDVEDIVASWNLK